MDNKNEIKDVKTQDSEVNKERNTESTPQNNNQPQVVNLNNINEVSVKNGCLIY